MILLIESFDYADALNVLLYDIVVLTSSKFYA